MIQFKPVSKYKDAELPLPTRGTEFSAGYDLAVAKDIVIPPYPTLIEQLKHAPFFDALKDKNRDVLDWDRPRTLSEIAEMTKKYNLKPTLVSTGMKCYLDPGTYLELSVRSSTPLKYWLILANGVGIIDADYADNPDNEGEIFFQLINLSTFPIQLYKGDKIGQGIIKPYLTADDDIACGKRKGGFGSSDNKI